MIQMTGFAELDSKFDGLNKSMQGKLTRRVTREVAKSVLALAKARVPVDSGDLEASLVVRSATGRKRRGEISHSVMTRDGMFRGDQFYGGFVELGYTHRSGSYVPADSFLRYALYGEEEKHRRMFRDLMAEELRRGVIK